MSKLGKIVKEMKWGHNIIRLEYGEIARKTNGSVLVSMLDTVILANVVGLKTSKIEYDFFPLTVDYIEKCYSLGKIPGNFFKREGRPSENEILVSRFIDRSLRPLFPSGFNYDVNVTVYVLSRNYEIFPDILSLIGVFAALSISEIPLTKLIGAARIGFINDEYILNPTYTQKKKSNLDLLISGTNKSLFMIELESNQLSNNIIFKAIKFAKNKLYEIINFINKLVDIVGKSKWKWKSIKENDVLDFYINEIVYSEIQKAYLIYNKKIRLERLMEIYLIIQINLEDIMKFEEIFFNYSMVNVVLYKIEKFVIKCNLLEIGVRIDGRKVYEIRSINARTDVLPRVHGSSLFTRGETQILSVVTLGTKIDEQFIDSLYFGFRDRFILHYNMPSFSTGEINKFNVPKRREIGHGNLVKKSLISCLPNFDVFGYSIRVVSEVLESNGSSSMSSVCGSCLALLDAGVPINTYVAGIAMGLLICNKEIIILTDILGDEDYFGDVDFKVSGTIYGLTSIQMDVKISNGIVYNIIDKILKKAIYGLMFILDLMNEVIIHSNNKFIPNIFNIRISQEKIRYLIGKGGSIIRSLTDKTNTVIEVFDNGIIKIIGNNLIDIINAKNNIKNITSDIEINEIYFGKIIRLFEFGVIISLIQGRDGFLHISEVMNIHIKNINDYLYEGQKIIVRVVMIDDKNKIKLSSKFFFL